MYPGYTTKKYWQCLLQSLHCYSHNVNHYHLLEVLSMDQIEQTVCKQMTDVKLWLLYSNTWNHLIVCKKEHRWFQKTCLGCKDFYNQVRLGRPKTMDSDAVLQAIEANLASISWKLSGKFSISKSNVISPTWP